MHYVYLLRSISNPDQTYIGFTEDLKTRLAAHNHGQSSHTAKFKPWELINYLAFKDRSKALARMFHELLSRDREDGRATGQPQGVGREAYLNGTSQGATPEDALKDGHIRGRSRLFIKHPG